jgi:hypothetical protein
MATSFWVGGACEYKKGLWQECERRLRALQVEREKADDAADYRRIGQLIEATHSEYTMKHQQISRLLF